MGITEDIQLKMSEIILKAENLSKSFSTIKKNQVNVLKDVSLGIEKEKISVIIGASGAGKSTLLHLLGGLDKPDSGSVYFNDIDISKLSNDKLAKFRNENIGFVFQFHHLLPEFTAVENVIIPQLIGGVSMNAAVAHAGRIISLVGLNERGTHKPAELSGGEQQRVALARALANNPALIFADEPTGNLDSVSSEGIHSLIKRLNQEEKKTFVIVTHNPDLIKLADNLYEIRDGRIEVQSN